MNFKEDFHSPLDGRRRPTDISLKMRMIRPFIRLSFALLAALALRPLAAAAPVPEKVRFNEQIRPILSSKCFFCHGPDEKHREASLRLDVRENAVAEHDGGKPVVPGKPEESELLERILATDVDDIMPPPKSKRARPTEEEIALLRKWIAQGAEYEGHWAFLPLRKDPPPQTSNTAWAKNPIDQFVAARLEREGLSPSAEADRATLIRRVSLDLTGLLPSPEQVEAFVNDPAPDAYERLVDQLLADRHYGERWGRHWLDQARYADSNGYTIDSERTMWPFRDWVIKALNDDMPFDQFTLEQLAGDLLPHPTKSQLIATAFHRNTGINEEGGVKPEQYRVEAALDRLNTTGSVWLGLTVGCAQCHTHKFDPIPHKEYYQMLAFFNQGEDVNNKGQTLEVARGEIFGEAPPAEIQRKREEQPANGDQPAWEQRELAELPSAPATTAQWSPAQYTEYDTASGAGFRLLDDNSLLSDGRGAFNDTYRIVAKSSLSKIAAIRLRVLTHESLPHSGPGMANNGNFVLTTFEASHGGHDLAFTKAFADHEQPGYAAAAAIDDQAKTGWAINVGKDSKVKMNANHEIVFVLDKPEAVEEGTFEIKLHHDLNQSYLIGRFAIDFAEAAPSPAPASRDALIAALKLAPDARSAEQVKLVRDTFERESPRKKSAPSKRTSDPNIAELMIMKDVPAPRPTFIFLRGDFLRPDEKTGPLTPGVLSAVNTVFQHPTADFQSRLDLARWLVNPENPLTPRVAVNRLWMHYFGRGIVETDDDFGTQGTFPTHPELLDWLAGEFMRRGWSMKSMHRLIVTSATYRQSSKARPDAAEKDPRNLLLSHQERVRFDAEIIRDAALSASGLLDSTIGGPSVHPPQPEGVFTFTQQAKKWTADTGPSRYRRALYTFFYRSAPHPLFTAFDAPSFQVTCTRRPRSDTPLQALTMANDAAFTEMAQGLAARVLCDVPGGDATTRITRAFFICLSREPSAKELAVLTAYHDQQRQSFAQDPAAAEALMSPALVKAGIKPEDGAALVCVARAIMNTDAFITRE